MSRDQYSHMRQQFCGVSDYCDVRGSIYPKIKIMAVWRQIHHPGHTPPRNHDLPHLCDFPDVSNKRKIHIIRVLRAGVENVDCFVVLVCVKKNTPVGG